MEVINQTNFKYACIPGRIPYPGHSLTLIVKATFDLSPQTAATPSEEQLYPSGDQFYPDDVEMQGSPRYESDFAYFKPRADLLLAGRCHAPGGNPISSCLVTFGVGNRIRSLRVSGDRYWRRGFLSSSITRPETFTEMELRYENSFGGEGYAANPVGKGRRRKRTADGRKVRPLPNLEDPDEPMSSPGSRPDPAGFGPLGRMWKQRRSKMGTYRGRYTKTRWPWFPEDLDCAHFNAAPLEMQLEGYLKGGEGLFFENLHCTHARYESRLPGLRVRCFIEKASTREGEEGRLGEVDMRLDTLWVDMESEKLVLVWRGWTEVQSEEYQELEHVFIVSEALHEPAHSIEHYHAIFKEQLAEEERQWAAEEPEPTEEEETAGDSTEDPQMEEKVARAQKDIRARLLSAGYDPDNLPPPDEETRRHMSRILEQSGIEPEEPEEETLTREKVLERLGRRESFRGIDLSELDLSGLDMTGVDLTEATLAHCKLMRADLTGADLTGANLTAADLTGATLARATLVEADLTGALAAEADLRGAVLGGAIFARSRMTGANLEEIRASDADFSESDLSNARFRSAELSGADLSMCLLHGADFRKAKLGEASVEGAQGTKVDFSEADLTELRASDGCDFSEGCFVKATGAGATWHDARLNGADFSYASMENADFTSASLSAANLQQANMKFARFRKADLSDARLVRMNLFQGSLEKANLTRADLRGSNLYGVEFLECRLEEARFQEANLKMTKLAHG